MECEQSSGFVGGTTIFQVDHSTRSLSVDGRPFNGIGAQSDDHRPIECPHTHASQPPSPPPSLLPCLALPSSPAAASLYPLSQIRRVALGWYMSGLDAFGDGSPGYAGYVDLPQYAVHRLAPAGVNHGMIYRLFDFPADHQLKVLDELAAGGFKVWCESPHVIQLIRS